MTDASNNKVLIAGLGKSGMAAARLLASQGMEVYAYDGKDASAFPEEQRKELEALGVRCYLGREPDTDGFRQVVASPGMPLTEPVLKQAARNGAEIIGELELAYRSRPVRFVAITGTNGKTTTTALVGEMYRLAGLPHRIVGNIGTPVADQILSAEEDAVMVTEVSSFQLETIVDFRPRVAALLNITPDHLDRHGSLEEYVRVKFKVFENQREEDYCVYNADDALSSSLPERGLKGWAVPFSARKSLSFGAFVRDGQIMIAGEQDQEIALCPVEALRIPGAHNLENALAAAATAYFAGVPAEAIGKALRTFAGVEHRIETVAEINGVAYINDSKGTNPDAAIKAILSVPRPLLLIAGGYEKNADFDPFTAAFEGRVRYLILLGKTAERIARSAEKNGFPKDAIHFCADMGDCVREAAQLALPGDAVLLSPACASWGMYNNFEERGRHFKELVRALGA